MIFKNVPYNLLTSLAIVSLALVVGCSKPQEPDTFLFPLLLRFPGEETHCAKPVSGVSSPEEWERSDFKRRILDGRIVYPINVACLREAFSDAELRTASGNGDPVATVADIVGRYSETNNACMDFSEIQKKLEQAYRVPNTVYDGPISRVPEAAFILSQLEEYCKYEDLYHYRMLLAYDLGYDASFAQKQLVE